MREGEVYKMHPNTHKVITIDTNHNYLGPNKPIVTPYCIEFFKLNEGDIVIAYQDEDEWEGVVRFDGSLPEEYEWYIELTNVRGDVSSDKKTGREEGRLNGMYLGELKGKILVAKKLLTDGVDIEKVHEYTKLKKSRLENLKKTIEKGLK